MIYFLQRADGAIKIGLTTNKRTLDSRIIVLDKQFDGIRLFGVIPGFIKHERELHEKFSNYRIRMEPKRIGYTEWFFPYDELTCYIQRFATSNIMLCVRFQLQRKKSDNLLEEWQDYVKSCTQFFNARTNLGRWSCGFSTFPH
jgi:hypothetical protein